MALNKNILYVIHNDVEILGGSEFATSSLIHGLKNNFNIFLLFKNKNYLFLRKYYSRAEENLIFKIKHNKTDDLFFNKSIDGAFKAIIRSLNIDIVHFQHLIGIPLSVIKTAKQQNCKTIITMHDYFYFCPFFKLLNNKNLFCNFQVDTNKCDICLQDKRPTALLGKQRIYNGFQKYRRDYIKDILNNYTDAITVPSQYLKDKFLNLYKIPMDKIKVIEYGNYEKSDYGNIAGDKLNAAFLGVFKRSKGSGLFAKVVKKTGNSINWHIIGCIIDWDDYFTIRRNVKKHTDYLRKDVFRILKQERINIILSPSIWPETYMLTISEAWLNNVPVVTTGYGVQAERVRENNAGWVFKENDFVEKTAALLKNISQNEINEKINNIPALFTIKDNIEEYAKLYSYLGEERKKTLLTPGNGEKLTLKSINKPHSFLLRCIGITKYLINVFLIKSRIGYFSRLLSFKVKNVQSN